VDPIATVIAMLVFGTHSASPLCSFHSRYLPRLAFLHTLRTALSGGGRERHCAVVGFDLSDLIFSRDGYRNRGSLVGDGDRQLLQLACLPRFAQASVIRLSVSP